ncbi:MAG TPA: GIY-YIG nuclease family protein [Candidatus Woesebacteria bacterium]|nr:GIY-YIG nuclease family protein [Candidatus Shapirobacteria bacterium]HOR02092.1 GIY-YIG nuclease family protein [Candidatus Woesebacteria bacterium]
MPYTYILASVKDNSYYIGSTNNLKNRIEYHNEGRSKYTKLKKPWNLIYFEEFSSLSLARKREKQIKSWKSREAIERLIKTRALSSSG